MRKTSKFILSVFLVTVIIWTILPSYGLAQEIGAGMKEPLPPPVDIKFTVENISYLSQEVTLKLKITVHEDMHTDISCLLPEGIKPVREKGIIVRPYRDKRSRKPQQTRYRAAVMLWVGPLKEGTTKEFIFRVNVSDKEKYELIARVEALAKWGVKEEILTIKIN